MCVCESRSKLYLLYAVPESRSALMANVVCANKLWKNKTPL